MRFYHLRRLFLLALVPVTLSACASFSNVRAAQVKQGTSFSAYYTATADLGESATYLWETGQLDQCDPCSHALSTLDLSVRKGIRSSSPTRAYELGAGITGLSQVYAEGFIGWQQQSSTPMGVGARVAVLSVDSDDAGLDYRLDGRFDVRLTDWLRILVNPALYYHRTTRDDPSWVFAAVPGIGLEMTHKQVSVGPSFAWVYGSGRRRDPTAMQLGLQDVKISVPVLSLNFTIHRINAVSARRTN